MKHAFGKIATAAMFATLAVSSFTMATTRESMGPAIKTGKAQMACRTHRSKQERNARKRIRKARRKNR
jgi:hypothetical protein